MPWFHQDIIKGIERHRAIDAYTDSHSAVDEMMRLLRPHQGKYTPVVADVLMDYILSKMWNHYHPRSLEDFCQSTYQTVTAHLDHIPERLHPRIEQDVRSSMARVVQKQAKDGTNAGDAQQESLI